MLDYGVDLPIFPLNTVLFPGMMLPLHIFEDRYKIMVKDCLDRDNIFGVVLAKNRHAVTPDVANIFVDDIFAVGTTAHITAVERLDDDRMNLITIGQERFLLKSIRPSQANYLIGTVDPLPLKTPKGNHVTHILAGQLRLKVEQYIQQLADASGEEFSAEHLPDDPESLAYLAGTALQGPLIDKQQLLAVNSLDQLVTQSVSVMDKENKILAYMLNAYNVHQKIQRLPFIDFSLN